MIDKIVINGKDFTVEEARELYNDLHQIFGQPSFPVIQPSYPSPYPYEPNIPNYDWWSTACKGLQNA